MAKDPTGIAGAAKVANTPTRRGGKDPADILAQMRHRLTVALGAYSDSREDELGHEGRQHEGFVSRNPLDRRAIGQAIDAKSVDVVAHESDHGVGFGRTSFEMDPTAVTGQRGRTR